VVGGRRHGGYQGFERLPVEERVRRSREEGELFGVGGLGHVEHHDVRVHVPQAVRAPCTRTPALRNPAPSYLGVTVHFHGNNHYLPAYPPALSNPAPSYLSVTVDFHGTDHYLPAHPPALRSLELSTLSPIPAYRVWDIGFKPYICI